MARHIVCEIDELTAGTMKTVRIGRSNVIVSRLPDGDLRAFAGRCPHQGADLSAGCISDAVESDRVNHLEIARCGETLRCPWHGFEFSLRDGLPAVPGTETMPLRLRFYDVEEDAGKVVVLT